MKDGDSYIVRWWERPWSPDINELCGDPFKKAKDHILHYKDLGAKFGINKDGDLVIGYNSSDSKFSISDIKDDTESFLDAKIEIARYITHLKIVKFLDFIYGAIDLKLKTASQKAILFFLKRYDHKIDLIEEDINKTYSTLIDSRRSYVYHVSFLEIKKRGFDLFSLIAVGLTSIEAELQMYDNI